MIETKIACQCGNRFKFGLEAVGGRAPEGLRCPTCNEPVSPACNTLLDYLSGKTPSPAPAATRAVKEIRVACACGARYKFDLELAEQEMPAGVTCPGCQADLTTLANEQLRNYVATHAAALVAPPAATPATPPTPAPAVPTATDAPEVVPAASVAAAPPAPKPVEPAAPAAAAITDPFGPPAESKSNLPNLPTLDPSKFQPSGPAPKRPAPGAAKPPGSPAPKPAGKPGTGNAASKPPAQPAKTPAKTQAKTGAPNPALGIVGALVGALAGAAVWFAVIKATGSVATYLAAVVGVLAGLGARLLGRGVSSIQAGAACGFALLAMGLMLRTGFYAAQDSATAKRLAGNYTLEVEKAKAAKAAKTDEEIKQFMMAKGYNDAMTGTLSDKAVEQFKAKTLPGLVALAEDTPASREAYLAAQTKANRRGFDMDNDWDDTIGMIGLLSLVGGLLAAGFIAKK